MLTAHALLLSVLGCLVGPAAAAAPTVVLVARADHDIPDLSCLQVRRLFLGLPVLINGRPLHPIRNGSDARFGPIFLQQIVVMSQFAYDRQILMGVNRQGWIPPREVSSSTRILETLYADPHAVTFMWLSDGIQNPQLRIIAVREDAP